MNQQQAANQAYLQRAAAALAGPRVSAPLFSPPPQPQRPLSVAGSLHMAEADPVRLPQPGEHQYAASVPDFSETANVSRWCQESFPQPHSTNPVPLQPSHPDLTTYYRRQLTEAQQHLQRLGATPQPVTIADEDALLGPARVPCDGANREGAR